MLTFSINPKVYIRGNIKMPNTDRGREWMNKVWENALIGKCDIDTNPDAYGYKSSYYQNMNKAKHEVQILSEKELEEGQRGVAEAVLKVIDLGLDRIGEQEEIMENLIALKELSNEMVKEKRVNLCICIISALKGDRKSINVLKELLVDEDCTYLLRKVMRRVKGLSLTGNETVNEAYNKRVALEEQGRDMKFSDYIKEIMQIKSVGVLIEGMM